MGVQLSRFIVENAVTKKQAVVVLRTVVVQIPVRRQTHVVVKLRPVQNVKQKAQMIMAVQSVLTLPIITVV